MLPSVSLAAMGLLFASATPQLLVLPPQPKGIPEIQAIEAWETISAEFQKNQKKLGISMSLQNSAQGILLGMGKKNSWKCKAKVSCLVNLGEDLDAQYLVTGRISPEKVMMMIIDVRAKKRLLRIRAGKKLTNKPMAAQARIIARGLVKGLKRKLNKKKKRAKSKRIAKKTPKKKAKKKTKKVATAKRKARTQKPKPIAKPQPSRETTIANAKVPSPSISGPKGSLDGMIRLSAAKLKGVTKIKVDGMTIPIREDGSAVWMGAPGIHDLLLSRGDGAVARLELIIDPRQMLEPALVWKKETPIAMTTNFEDYEIKRPNWEQWWFWASLGGAVLAGGLTAGVLMSGNSGGPDVAGPTGTVTGSY
jgi:hypothetical protein